MNSTVQYITVQYCTLQYSTIQYCTVQCGPWQYLRQQGMLTLCIQCMNPGQSPALYSEVLSGHCWANSTVCRYFTLTYLTYPRLLLERAEGLLPSVTQEEPLAPIYQGGSQTHT